MDSSKDLHQQRHYAVLEVLKNSGATRVLDMGCGDGKFMQLLASEPRFIEVVGADVSAHSLEQAAIRLRLDDLPARERARIQLFQASLTAWDIRFEGYDAIVLNEVIEHIEPAKLDALERVVFGQAKPRWVMLTTPNREYNRLLARLYDGKYRHPDHRFEWTRAEFQRWAERVAKQYNYSVLFASVGPEDPQAGPLTQMSVFNKR